MKLLEQGNATMGVWLGKQLLGQTDHIEMRGQPVVIVMPTLTTTVEQTGADHMLDGVVIDVHRKNPWSDTYE